MAASDPICQVAMFDGNPCARPRLADSDYCILHAPCSKDLQEFTRNFEETAQEAHETERPLDCTRFVFPDGLMFQRNLALSPRANLFKDATFEGRVVFHVTNFGERAAFLGTEFHGPCDFLTCTFEDAQWRGCHWHDEVQWHECQFERVTVADCEAHGTMAWDWSSFNRFLLLSDVVARGKLKLNHVISTGETSLSTVKLPGGGELRDSSFERLLLTNVLLPGEAKLNLRTATVQFLILENVDLSNWFLVPLHGIEQSVFSAVRFPRVRGPRCWNLSREALAEDVALHEGGEGLVRPDLIEHQYRVFKKQAMDARNQEAASLFHFAERETLRWEAERTLTRWLLGLYGATCGHGERPWRTLGWSTLLILAFAIVHMFVGGFEGLDGTRTVLYEPVLDLGRSGDFSRDAIEAAAYSLRWWLPFDEPAAPVAAPSPVSSLLITAEQVIGAVLTALFALAFGRKLQR